jgi:hypothetical protein
MKRISSKEYAEIIEYGIITSKPLPNQNQKWARFAEACYNQNTVDELLSALHSPADEDDCREWGITPSEWKQAIVDALAAKAYDYRNP